jgi:hypothetical protein
MTNKPQVDENTLRTMQELLRQPPKPHDQMKLGKRKGQGRKSHVVEGTAEVKRGRKPKGKAAMTNAESVKKYRTERKESGYKTAFEEIAASKKARPSRTGRR